MPGTQGLRRSTTTWDKLPNLQGKPPPILPRKHIRRTSGSLSSMDLGRGCPYQCSFCTIINVQGRKSRFRSPDDLEKIVRENYAQSIRRFFITDDNFARNRDWELLFDRLVEFRAGDCPKIGFTIQVDTLCHKTPNFIEKAAQAGVRRVFIGLENINPDNLIPAQETPEQDHRLPADAAEMARARRRAPPWSDRCSCILEMCRQLSRLEDDGGFVVVIAQFCVARRGEGDDTCLSRRQPLGRSACGFRRSAGYRDVGP
jgi:hypothetical protein